MRGELAPGLVVVEGVQASGPSHHQPKPGRLGEDDVQHKHKPCLAVPVKPDGETQQQSKA